jgi:hypothetical protein
VRWFRLTKAESRLLGAPSEVDALGALSLSLDSSWVEDRLFVIVTAFVDETGIDGERVTLAGYVATLGRWHGFNFRWNNLLDEAEIPYSHITEMKKGDHPFEGWDEAKALAFIDKAAPLMPQYCGFGLSVHVNKAHRAAYAANMPPKTNPDSAYGMCARQFFEKVPEFVASVMKLRNVRINFVFERQNEHFAGAEQIFHELKRVDDNLSRVLGTITPGEKDEFCGLQAADMFAYVARKAEPTAKFSPVPPDGRVFEGQKRVRCPHFRVNIGEDAIPKYHEVAGEIRRRRRYRDRKAKKAAKQPS